MERPTTGAPAKSESDINSTPLRAAWQSDHLGERSRALFARDNRAFLHQSVSTPCLAPIVKAEGLYIEDMDGRRYMDVHGNNVHHVGHAHPRVVAAIKAQLDELCFAPRRFASERAVELAEALGARFRALTGNAGRVLFTTGGSDAVEVAIRLARIATGHFKTLSFWDAFHGAGFGTSSVGGESLFRGGGHGPLLPGSEHVAPFGCYRCAYGHKQPGRQAARRHARRIEEAARSPAGHGHLRHARPGRGHDDGRPDRDHERRLDPPGRRPAGGVRAAPKPVRRGLHRLADHEFHQVHRGVEERPALFLAPRLQPARPLGEGQGPGRIHGQAGHHVHPARGSARGDGAGSGRQRVGGHCRGGGADRPRDLPGRDARPVGDHRPRR